MPTGILGQSAWHSGTAALIPFILSGGSVDLYNTTPREMSKREIVAVTVHFTDEETEAQREEVTSSESWSWEMGCKPQPDSKHMFHTMDGLVCGEGLSEGDREGGTFLDIGGHLVACGGQLPSSLGPGCWSTDGRISVAHFSARHLEAEAGVELWWDYCSPLGGPPAPR